MNGIDLDKIFDYKKKQKDVRVARPKPLRHFRDADKERIVKNEKRMTRIEMSTTQGVSTSSAIFEMPQERSRETVSFQSCQNIQNWQSATCTHVIYD